MFHIYKWSLFFFCFLVFTSSAGAQASEDLGRDFQTYAEKIGAKSKIDGRVIDKNILEFYKNRNFEPIWFNFKGSWLSGAGDEKRDFDEDLDVIRTVAYAHGLDPDRYDVYSDLNENDIFAQEWARTDTVLRFINDLSSGSIEPQIFDPQIFLPPKQHNPVKTLEGYFSTWSRENYLQDIAPQHPEYKRLLKALAHYRSLEQGGGWPILELKSGTLIYPGQYHEAIPQVEARLGNEFHEFDGQLPEQIWQDRAQIDGADFDKIILKNKTEKGQGRNGNSKAQYTKKLAKKIMEFQYFHGQVADGVIGPDTIAALNTPVEARIEQIRLAMERWRWLPRNLGEKHIRVNIAAFYARAVENGEDQFVMPIIVGQVAHQTPVFSSFIKNVKIHPDWTSPDSIAERYVIPKIQNDPAVVYRLGYQAIDRQSGEVVPWEYIHPASLNTRDYIFRQRPGNKNALGLARFSIENDYAIFMHGTPSVELFNHDRRTFSSGCIRLENPLLMAHFLLHDQGISKSKLEDLYYLDEGEFPETTYIDLKKDVPVHLTYMTAWVDQQGHLHFADDVYGRDDKLADALGYTRN